jgi:transposase-like protein
MESIIKDSPTKTRRKFDKSFKCEVVRNWLSSGKSAAVIAKEFGLNESLLFAWRKLLPPAEAGGKAAAGCVGHDDELGGESPLWGLRKATTG